MLYTETVSTLLSLCPLAKEEAAAQTIDTQQVVTQQIRMFAPLASLPTAVPPSAEAVMPSTMTSSTNAGKILAILRVGAHLSTILEVLAKIILF